jgi:eukaryotic-like serine/threonine-protein kinase
LSADLTLPGRTFGRYELRELVAVSGMGVVYRAWDPTLACVVAIKLVSENTIPDESARSQLYTEARIASSLNHTNICRIKDVIEESGQAGIVMEYVEGQGMRRELTRCSAWRLEPLHQIADSSFINLYKE